MKLKNDANFAFVHLYPVSGIRLLAHRLDGQLGKGIQPEPSFEVLSDLDFVIKSLRDFI